MQKLLSRITHFSFVRFLIAGGFNTAMTYLLYLILLTVVSYQVSYTIAYVLGILLAFGLNRFFVFKTHRGVQSVLIFPFVYLIQYTVSIYVLWLWVEHYGLNDKLAPLAAIIITVPLTYLLSRLIFKQKSR